MTRWVEVCETASLESEDVLRFDYEGKTYAVYRGPDDAFYATDGLCTHEAIHLADGFVIDYIIECPKHSGQFDYRDGEPKGPPVCKKIGVHPTKVENAKVYLGLSE